MKSFTLELNEKEGCCLLVKIRNVHYCNYKDAYCDGNLCDRPRWCPLKEHMCSEKHGEETEGTHHKKDTGGGTFV